MQEISAYGKYLVDREMFKEEILIPFEDDEFKALKEYDKLLSSMYRDYMIPPLKGKR